MPYGLVAPMRCPSCGGAGCEVIDSRVSSDGTTTRRRRRCTHCQGRFTTYERAEGTKVETRIVGDVIDMAKQLRHLADELEKL